MPRAFFVASNTNFDFAAFKSEFKRVRTLKTIKRINISMHIHTHARTHAQLSPWKFPHTNAAGSVWLALYPVGEFCSLEISLRLGEICPLAPGKVQPQQQVYSDLHQLNHCSKWICDSETSLLKGIEHSMHRCCRSHPLPLWAPSCPNNPLPSPSSLLQCTSRLALVLVE